MYADLERIHGIPIPIEIRKQTSNRLRAAMRDELLPIPGIADIIGQLGSSMCVASNSGPEYLADALKTTGLIGAFAPHIFSAHMVEHGKPAPDLFLYAAAQMKVAPADCLVIEDSINGVKAGVAAGMTVFGFDGASHCGPGYRDKLSAAGARLVFDDMAGLPGLIAGSAR